MLYGYFQEVGTTTKKYCLVCLKPKSYINGSRYSALVLGTWKSKMDIYGPDENGRTFSELRSTYSLMMCEDRHDAELSIRRFEPSICKDAEEHAYE